MTVHFIQFPHKLDPHIMFHDTGTILEAGYLPVTGFLVAFHSIPLFLRYHFAYITEYSTSLFHMVVIFLQNFLSPAGFSPAWTAKKTLPCMTAGKCPCGIPYFFIPEVFFLFCCSNPQQLPLQPPLPERSSGSCWWAVRPEPQLRPCWTVPGLP